jgi:hypothetical protein
MDSGLAVHQDDSQYESAEPFFKNGSPTDTVKEIADYLTARARRMKYTDETCALLLSSNLIKEWDLQIETGKGVVQVENLYCVDEEKLNALSPSKLATLRDKDALTLAYGQLFSMINVNLLASQFNKTDSSPNLGFSLEQNSDSLSFDNI